MAINMQLNVHKFTLKYSWYKKVYFFLTRVSLMRNGCILVTDAEKERQLCEWIILNMLLSKYLDLTTNKAAFIQNIY